MTEYTDITTVNSLYIQSEQVATAIQNLDDGGGPSQVTIAPPPPPPIEPGMPPVMSAMAMSTSIMLVGPFTPALIAELRSSLVDLQNKILTDLAGLGVTATPPAARAAPPAR